MCVLGTILVTRRSPSEVFTGVTLSAPHHYTPADYYIPFSVSLFAKHTTMFS